MIQYTKKKRNDLLANRGICFAIKIHQDVIRTIKSLRLNAKQTRRGKREGVKLKHQLKKGKLNATMSHNIGNNTSRFKYGLLNTRSIRNKTETIHELVIDKDFDCLAITETWLSLSDIESDIVKSFTPEGYSFLHFARSQCKAGGSIGLLYKSSISVKEVTSESNFKTFEHQEFQLNLRSSTVCVNVLYQLPPIAANGFTFNSFMDEFSDYLTSFSSSPNSILIMGDFNIHFDDSNNRQTQAFSALLSSVNLQQLVKT